MKLQVPSSTRTSVGGRKETHEKQQAHKSKNGIQEGAVSRVHTCMHLEGILRLYPIEVERQVLLGVRVAVRPEALLEVRRSQGRRLERLASLVPLGGVLQELQQVFGSELGKQARVNGKENDPGAGDVWRARARRARTQSNSGDGGVTEMYIERQRGGGLFLNNRSVLEEVTFKT